MNNDELEPFPRYCVVDMETAFADIRVFGLLDKEIRVEAPTHNQFLFELSATC